MSPDIVIVGAGITGGSTAYELSKAGFKVEVFERYFPAAMASGWTLAGVRQSGRHQAELPLAKYSIDKWSSLSEELQYNIGYIQEGNLRLARDEGESSTIQLLVKQQKEAGLDITYLSNNKSVREVAPLLSEQIHSASFCRTDGHADPVATVEAYKLAAERNGCIFHIGREVKKLCIDEGKLEGVVSSEGRINTNSCLLACGVQTNLLMTDSNFSVPMSIPIVTVIQTEPVDKILKPVIGVGNANMSMRQEKSGSFRLSSGAQDWNGSLTEKDKKPYACPSLEKVYTTLDLGFNVLPLLKKSPIRDIWGGLLDLTPDALPVMDKVPDINGLYVASGFSGHGFGIAPATSHILSNLLLNKPSELPAEAFSIRRFENHKSSEENEEPTLHG